MKKICMVIVLIWICTGIFAIPVSAQNQQNCEDSRETVHFNSKIKMVGSASYRIQNDQIIFFVNQIRNSRFRSTADLTLKLWATDAPYAGGTIEGYIIGTVRIGRIGGGDVIQDIEVTAHYSEPPEGMYYTTLVLVEKTEKGEIIADYMAFPSAKTFGR